MSLWIGLNSILIGLNVFFATTSDKPGIGLGIAACLFTLTICSTIISAGEKS